MKYLLLIFVLLFSACSTKHYEQTKTKLIVIKSPKLKFADVGYIRNTSDDIELELFSAGQSLQKININHLICVSDSGCMSKSSFNEEYLNASYPDDILQNILLSHVIYNGKNKTLTNDGFEQYIKDNNVNIIYRTNSKNIYFKDKQNGILLKIKDIK